MALSIFSKIRLENKKVENGTKSLESLTDILQTAHYKFTKNHGISRVGDSGELLFAFSKKDSIERYIVKHAFGDCACNEYVYSKIAYAMNIKIPSVKLFTLSEGEKRRYFKTEYLGAIEFLEIKKEGIRFRPSIQEEVSNWHDYFKFMTLYNMFSESDSFEIVQTIDNCLYKIDNCASFMIGAEAENLGLIESLERTPFDDIVLNLWSNETSKIQLKKIIEEIFSNKLLHLESDFGLNWGLNYGFNTIKKNYGNDYLKYYLEPLEKIQEIPQSYIDSILNNLCYVYPDSLGNYYEVYLKICQKYANKFLKENKFS